MKNQKIILLTLAVLAIGGSIYYLESIKTQQVSEQDIIDSEIAQVKDNKDKIKQFETAKEITTPDGFINVGDISISEFIGNKVVLVDFWTYSCINCQRTTPYLNAWHDKYSDDGLVIIGVHTPEFKFEEDYDNVVAATRKFGINYPVVLDNDYSTWRAYENRYWPRKYLIDIDGFIIYDHIGEGGYEETERQIQEALKERMDVLGIDESVKTGFVKPKNIEKVDTTVQRSPEIYFGATRNESIGNGEPGKIGVVNFELPPELNPSNVYFEGEWNITHEYAENIGIGSKIIIRYLAEKVFVVASSEKRVDVEILQDGIPLSTEAGDHVKIINGKSVISVKEDGLYRIVDNPEGNSLHTLELIISEPGVRVFTFTFG